MPRKRGIGSGSRFLAGVLGAVLASLAWITIVMWVATTPDQAREERSAPTLPPPTVAVIRTALRQVVWHECRRHRLLAAVSAPRIPRGYRPVVTLVAKSGTPTVTGSLLARVADQPVIAVETEGILYRDLVLGDQGDDVRAFEEALRRAGLIRHPDSVLDAGTLNSWRTAYDPSSPSDRVRLSTLVTVRPHSEVADVRVEVGDLVGTNSPLMEVRRASKSFSCSVSDPPPGLSLQDVSFRAGGSPRVVAGMTVHPRTRKDPGSVDILPQAVSGPDEGQLGIVGPHSQGPVLAVPLSAIKVSASGEQSVVVISRRSEHVVSVALGATAQGLVEVAGPGLREGVQVELFDQALEDSAMSPPATTADAGRRVSDRLR
jgi:hypothetical protein